MIFINAENIAKRRADDIKPAGAEILIQDGNNSRKAHHIIHNLETGETFYNQAIQDGTGTWRDFYDWDLVGTMEWHGYRKQIDAAIGEIGERVRRVRRLMPGNCLKILINSGPRHALVLACTEDLALVVYEMPNGRTYLKETTRWPRKDRGGRPYFIPGARISWNNIPPRWLNAYGGSAFNHHQARQEILMHRRCAA